MSKVEFLVDGNITRARDAAYLVGDDDPLRALIESARETVSTQIMVTCAGVTMHLAAWEDPEYWADDWAEKGIEPDEVYTLVAGAVRE